MHESKVRPLSSEKTMQAWQINSYGDLSGLKLNEVTMPVIKNPTDILVQVEAASVNPIDQLIIEGYGKTLLRFMRRNELEFPLTLGRDFSGVVIEKGKGVSDEFKVGDPVFGIIPPHKQGSHAEIVLCSEETIARIPDNVSSVEAGAVVYAAMTAWSALFLTGGLLSRSPNKHAVVLILGASGGVGTLAVQMLKAQGDTVIATCSNDAIPLVQSMGADQIFDYRDKDYLQNIAQAGQYDIILDCAQFGYQNIPNTWRYKRFVTLNSPLLSNIDRHGFIGGLAISAKDILTSNFPKIFQGKTVKWGYVTARKDGLNFIAKLIENGQLKPAIHKVFKFDAIPAAFQELSSGHLRGKVVVDFSKS